MDVTRWLAGLLAGVSLLLLSSCGKETGPQGAPPAPEVIVAEIKKADVPLIAELPGRIAPLKVAEVRPQVGGIVQKRLFQEGSDVNAGDLLYQIEDAKFRADVESARAELARTQAVLTKAQLREKRLARLINTKAVSEEDYDLAAAELREAEAGVAAARAALNAATIDLGFTRVLAPISGRIGKSLITEGALVEAEQEKELAVIQQIDQVYVDITQSTIELLRLKRELASGQVRRKSEPMALSVLLEDGSEYQRRGTLEFSEISVDEGTSSVTLRGTAPNPDHLLLPGMFVRARVDQGLRADSILIPQRGLTFDYSGSATAMVVGEGNIVEQRTLQVGQALDDHWLVLDGLAPGEKVIVEGLQKIRAGMEVKVVNAAAASDSE